MIAVLLTTLDLPSWGLLAMKLTALVVLIGGLVVFLRHWWNRR